MSVRRFRLWPVVLSTAIACALACLPSPRLFALDPEKTVTQYLHDVWQTENGLPQNSVRAITQTRDGYLWLGTEEGLVRFDGVAFTVFDKGNVAAMASNTILALHEDRDGKLWIGTYNGGLLRLRDGRFTAFTTAQGLTNAIVWCIGEDRQGHVRVGTDGGGLNLVSGERLIAFPRNDGLPNQRVTAVCEDREDNLWIGTVAGLARWRDGHLTTFTTKDGLSSNVVMCLLEDRQGNLWIGTRGGGLDRLRDGKFVVFGKKEGLSSDIVRCLAEDRQGNLWIGTTGGGLDRLTGGKIATFGKAEGLSHENVASVFEDREADLWIGTDGGGLNRLRDGRATPFSTQEGLSNDMVWCVHEDREGALWFGTWGSGLDRLKAGSLHRFTTADGLGSDRVWVVDEDRQGTLWVGTYGGGLSRFRAGSFTTFTTRDGLSSDNVMSLCAAREGALWIGTFGGGLDRLEGGRFTAFGKAQGLANDNVIAVHEDRAGRLWVATFGGGLYRLDGGRFIPYTARDGLSSDTLTSLYEDRDGSLWIGTFGGGLNRLKDGRIRSCTRQNGLFDDVTFYLLADDAGYLWMSSNRGIFRVAKKELDDFFDGRIKTVTSTSFTKADGMRSAECNSGAACKTRGGRLWFPTIRGAAMLDPSRLGINRVPPPVVIESVTMDDQLARTPAQVFPPGPGRLEIHYTALSLVAAERDAFAFKLVGFDRDWADAGRRRVAYYTNLPPGPYEFRVKAANNDGVWNETGASFSFYLKPHFYQTTPFYALCIVGIALALVGGHRLRVRELKVRERTLRALVEERTEELQRSNEMLASRSHQLERANQALQRLSYLDALTEIANRRYFQETLEVELRRAHRAENPVSLIMIDIDFFKAFNDEYGHQAGDDCLKSVAGILTGNLRRAGDLAARYGGEEFVVILPETNIQGAASLAERLRSRVEEAGIRHDRSEAGGVVTISLGVACSAAGSDRLGGALVAAADRALYQAKQGGRNRVVVSEALP